MFGSALIPSTPSPVLNLPTVRKETPASCFQLLKVQPHAEPQTGRYFRGVIPEEIGLCVPRRLWCLEYVSVATRNAMYTTAVLPYQIFGRQTSSWFTVHAVDASSGLCIYNLLAGQASCLPKLVVLVSRLLTAARNIIACGVCTTYTRQSASPITDILRHSIFKQAV